MNPRFWRRWRHSSLRYVYAEESPDWLSLGEVIADFKNRAEYIHFLEEYEERRQVLAEIRHELADK